MLRNQRLGTCLCEALTIYCQEPEQNVKKTAARDLLEQSVKKCRQGSFRATCKSMLFGPFKAYFKN